MKQLHNCKSFRLKPVFSLLLLLFLVTSVSAQSNNNQEERQKRWEEMKAKRAAFYTEHIGLTSEEAQLFWPVYNKLQDEKGQLNGKMRELHRNAKRDDKGEKILDYEKLTDEMIRIKVQEANLEKDYHEKFKKILTPEKLFKYYLTEREWGGELLKQIQKRGDPK